MTPERIAFTMTGTTFVSFGKPLESPKLKNEDHTQYDDRVWREHAHYTQAGQVYIPGMAVKYAIASAAKRAATKISGRGQARYSPIVRSSLLPTGDFLVYDATGKPVMRDELKCDRIYCHANGKPGTGTRVWRKFPRIEAGWTARAEMILNADELQAGWEYVFEFARLAGRGVGIGRWRAEVGGLAGAFAISDCVAIDSSGKKHKWE